MSDKETAGDSRTEERVMAIYGRIQQRAPAVTSFDDVDDFVNDAIAAVLDIPEAAWENNDYYLAQRGMLVARRMRYHERRRATVFNISDDDLEWMEGDGFGYTTFSTGDLDGEVVEATDVEVAIAAMPDHVQETFTFIREAVRVDESDAFYLSGTVRQTWLCQVMGRTSSAVHRSMKALRTALQPFVATSTHFNHLCEEDNSTFPAALKTAGQQGYIATVPL